MEPYFIGIILLGLVLCNFMLAKAKDLNKQAQDAFAAAGESLRQSNVNWQNATTIQEQSRELRDISEKNFEESKAARDIALKTLDEAKALYDRAHNTIREHDERLERMQARPKMVVEH